MSSPAEGSRFAGALFKGDPASPPAHHDHDEDGSFSSGKSTCTSSHFTCFLHRLQFVNCQCIDPFFFKPSDCSRLHHPCGPPGLRLPDRQPPSARHLGREDGVPPRPLPQRQPCCRGEVCLRAIRSW